MNIGMLWFDNDPKTELTLKIKRAADYYQHKYGRAPTLCFVHPSMVPGSSPESAETVLKSGDIEVRSSRSVLPNHFWLGINALTSALAV
jgi:hypothetical protein